MSDAEILDEWDKNETSEKEIDLPEEGRHSPKSDELQKK